MIHHVLLDFLKMISWMVPNLSSLNALLDRSLARKTIHLFTGLCLIISDALTLAGAC